MAVGAYLLSFLPGPPDDPLAPFVLAFGATLLAEGPVRLWRAAGGRYAPSLFGYLAPWSLLRPERVAWEAHRDAELTARRALEG
jgi:hypothetical protein